MYYAVIHKPETDVSKIEEIDAKYDPLHGLVPPHVTLLFPVSSEEVSLEALTTHVKDCASRLGPFSVEFTSSSTELSWDQWLFLTPTKGKEQFDQLHDDLYSGPMEKFLRKDLPFSPHIGVGHLAVRGLEYSLRDSVALPLDEERYKQALQDIEDLNLHVAYRAEEIQIIGVNDDYTKSWPIEAFKLG